MLLSKGIRERRSLRLLYTKGKRLCQPKNYKIFLNFPITHIPGKRPKQTAALMAGQMVWEIWEKEKAFPSINIPIRKTAAEMIAKGGHFLWVLKVTETRVEDMVRRTERNMKSVRTHIATMTASQRSTTLKRLILRIIVKKGFCIVLVNLGPKLPITVRIIKKEMASIPNMRRRTVRFFNRLWLTFPAKKRIYIAGEMALAIARAPKAAGSASL